MHKGYTPGMVRKDVAFKIRIEEDLRRAFVDVCRDEDRPAAQVVREFMREYVQKKDLKIQQSLFDENENTDD